MEQVLTTRMLWAMLLWHLITDIPVLCFPSSLSRLLIASSSPVRLPGRPPTSPDFLCNPVSSTGAFLSPWNFPQPLHLTAFLCTPILWGGSRAIEFLFLYLFIFYRSVCSLLLVRHREATLCLGLLKRERRMAVFCLPCQEGNHSHSGLKQRM